MTVDEILATGQYTDRRGRVWERGPSFVCNRDWFTWLHPLKRKMANDREMRLLIERNQHRDACPGMNECRNHPVPHVLIDTDEPGKFLVFEPNSLFVRWFMDSHSAALDAARALAVGE